MRIVLVAGARPNFMKVGPVLAELDRRGVDALLVHTGQHYDEAMSTVFFEELGIRRPDHHLECGSGSHAEQTSAVMVAFEALLESVRPDLVLVPGDVNGTMACAIVAAKHGCFVAHLEAGLRSRDWGMPEEINRVVTDRVSDLLLAPSADAVDNLRAEGYREDQIHLVGNVMIDTLMENAERAQSRHILRDLRLEPGSYGVLTMHRPANVDDAAVLSSLLATLSDVATTLPLIFPVHPRVSERIRSEWEAAGIRVIAPLGYLDFLSLQSQAAVMLTDSGGVQEETTVLGIPCLTLRENTERPITVTDGTNRLVGWNRQAIVEGVEDALAGRTPIRRPGLWDGRASTRVCDALLAIDRSAFPRPTSR